MTSVQTIGAIGAGTMGTGIARVRAFSGLLLVLIVGEPCRAELKALRAAMWGPCNSFPTKCRRFADNLPGPLVYAGAR
jgi:3-hydroxyacyl-CoA dehydrogenase